MIRGDDCKIRSAITQTAIRDGIATANGYKTKIKERYKVSEPVFRNPVVKITNTNWRLNPIADGYMAVANVGSKKHPCIIAIPIPPNVICIIEGHTLGELWITPTIYTIMYSSTVPAVKRPTPQGKMSTTEILADIGGVDEIPKGVIGVDINEKSVVTGNNRIMVKFDTSDIVQSIEVAKTCETQDAKYDRKHDNIQYKKRAGRKVQHAREEKKQELQKMLYDGSKLYKKLKRWYHNLMWVGKTQDDKDKKRMQMCVLYTNTSHTKTARAKNKKREISRLMKHHEHLLYCLALCIVQWAVLSGCVIVLEGLRGMSRGWQSGGRFGRRLSRLLHSSMMLKISDRIHEKVKFIGVEVLHMDPRDASKRCAKYRNKLTGNYHYTTWLHCHIFCVYSDINTAENILRWSAVAHYDQRVLASLGEVRHGATVISDLAPHIRGHWNDWADRLSAGNYITSVFAQEPLHKH